MARDNFLLIEDTIVRHPPHQTSTTPCVKWNIHHSQLNMYVGIGMDISCQPLGDECKLEGFCVPFGHRVGECTFLENVYCGVVDVWCGGCPMWWMSGVVDVRCGGCLVWWMSGVVDVWCGGCLVWWMSYFTHGVVDVRCGGCLCGGCPFLPMMWWMSGVVDVCVVDVVQSLYIWYLSKMVNDQFF